MRQVTVSRCGGLSTESWPLFLLYKVAEFFWNPSVGKYRRCNISVILHWPFLLQAHVDIKFISKEDRDGGQHCCGKLMKVLIMFPGIELLYLRKRPSSHSVGFRRYPELIFCLKLSYSLLYIPAGLPGRRNSFSAASVEPSPSGDLMDSWSRWWWMVLVMSWGLRLD